MSRLQVLSLLGAATLGGLGVALAAVDRSVFGGTPAGERLKRMLASPNFKDGLAQNPVPTDMGSFSKMAPTAWEYFAGGEEREPKQPPPTVRPDPASLVASGDPGLRLTWLGHSTVLLEVDGHLVLTDPVFAQRASPFQWSGPLRFHQPPLGLEELPDVDVVLLSHDHYDHLDQQSIRRLAERGARFVMPLGVGAHLEHWGVPAEQIQELDWWEELKVGELRLVCTPARHFSGRGMGDRFKTLWSSWAVIGPQHRVWFSGDTGPFEGAAEIGERLGPFDLTMLEIGAWNEAWGNIHLGPAEAVRMHQQVRGEVMMPVHWGTFSLALHAWDQPVVHLQQLAEQQGVTLLSPLAGVTVSPDHPQVAEFWRQRRALAE